jgi:lysophospholipase L1-like esterase
MLECLILGDSIAVGTKMFAPRECVSYSESGINSRQWNLRWRWAPLQAKTVVISLGTNDYLGIRTEKELRKLRSRVLSHRVVWIMPPCTKRFCNPYVNARVSRVAFDFGDRTISTDRLQGDGIHPTARGYQQLVRRAGL